MKIKKTASMRLFEVLAITLITVTAIFCVLPFVLIVSSSLTSNQTIIKEGYSLWPRDLSLEGYRTIFQNAAGILRAYGVTIYCTVIGTGIGLIMNAAAGYVLSRKEFHYRNVVSFLIYFTTIFGGGMIPWYYMYSGVLGLKGTMAVLWIPGLVAPFYIILMRTFVQHNLPDEITDAARMDGAGHWTIFIRIALPVLKPALATVGLFLALSYWNDWYRSSLFSNDSSTWELQFYLKNIIGKSDAARTIAASAGIAITDLPSESLKMAMAVVVTGPILFLYPFVQKYFVTGITIGSVKG